MEMLYIITVIMVTQPHIFLRTYPFMHLKLANFIMCKLCLNKSDDKSWNDNINIIQSRLQSKEY